MKKVILLFSSTMLLAACANVGNTSQETSSVSESVAEKSSIESKKDAKDTIAEIMENYESVSESEPETQTQETFNIGEEVVFYDDNNQELYGLTIKKVTTDLQAFSDFATIEHPDRTIEIVYEYTNYNYSEPLNVQSQFITAFNDDGKAGEDFGYRDGQTDVGPGRSAESKIWYIMPDSIAKGDPIEIDYGSDFSIGFDGFVTFKGTIE